MKRWLHRWFHFWEEYPYCRKPDRSDWFCRLRQCTVCRRVEYHSFGTFGDGKWYGLDDATGSQPWELTDINISARHIGLIKDEIQQEKTEKTELRQPTREELLAAIRLHRDQSGHDRCRLDDDALYSILPEGRLEADQTLPPKEEFLSGCAIFWERRKSGVSFEHCSLVEVMKTLSAYQARYDSKEALDLMVRTKKYLDNSLNRFQPLIPVTLLKEWADLIEANPAKD